jgi:hypothetical protein
MMHTAHHYHYIPESLLRCGRLAVWLLVALVALQLVAMLTPQPVRIVTAAEVAK